MSVNTVNSVSAADVANTYKPSAKKTVDEKDNKPAENSAWEGKGAVYDASAKPSAADRAAIVKQMQMDVDARVDQMRNLIAEMMGKQGKAAELGDGIWKMFADGNYKNVDAAAIAQAKEDIAEGGYWSADKTSDRILDFAVALAGDDKEKLGKMMDAFKEGYAKAEKMWGRELPDLCKNTYDSVLEKFDKKLNPTSEAEA